MLTKVRCSLGPKSGNEESLLTDKDCLLKCCFLFWIAVFGFNQGPQSFVAAGIAANDVRYVLVVRLFAQSLCIFLDSVVTTTGFFSDVVPHLLAGPCFFMAHAFGRCIKPPALTISGRAHLR